MKITRFAVLVALLCLVCVGMATAQNMSITDFGILGSQTVQVYNNNGTLVGTYNTTTNGIALPTEDFVLVVKPAMSDALADPTALLATGFAYVVTNVVPLAILAFLIGLVFKKW